jgi:hypothetical protein
VMSVIRIGVENIKGKQASPCQKHNLVTYQRLILIGI